jgi:hypothetical protein
VRISPLFKGTPRAVSDNLALLDHLLRHTFVPRIRYLGFTTRGKKGPLTTTGDLSACKSKRTLIQLLTVNSIPLAFRSHLVDVYVVEEAMELVVQATEVLKKSQGVQQVSSMHKIPHPGWDEALDPR